jgi:hypothetical protein
MFRDQITNYLRENGIRVSRVDILDDHSLVYHLSEDDAKKILRNLFTYQLDLDALISVSFASKDCIVSFAAAQFKSSSATRF